MAIFPTGVKRSTRPPRRTTGRAATAVFAAFALLVFSACATHQPPASGPEAEASGPEATGTAEAAGTEGAAATNEELAGAPEPPDPEWLRAAASSAGMDEEEVIDAEREARRTVAAMEEATRREFRQLFGSDPLGLAREPANAGRYEISLQMNESVQWWIDYFQNDIPDRFQLYLRRAGEYEDLIRARLREKGLPEDLLYLALIESGMNSNAYSRAHAVGMWQFIASTGRLYDLEVSYWVDERRDPVKATDAAIAHLSDLYDTFGSWYLAAAAYNAGPGRVRWGIARTGSDDFWDLADSRVLRRETQNYVPKLIAAALIAKHPERYGFDDVEPEPPARWDEVTVPDATSLDVIAEAAGTTEEVIRELNPQFRRHVTPPDNQAVVKVPDGHAQRFASAYAEIPPEDRVTWLVHSVTRGQTLSSIASRYGTSVQAIRAANDGVSPRRLQVGQRLVVPRSDPGGGSTGRLASASGDGPVTVTVQRGDTIWTLARRYGVSTNQIIAWNDLGTSTIHPGDRLEIRR